MPVPPTITEAHPPLPLDEITSLISAFARVTLAEKQAVIRRLVQVHPTLSLACGSGWKYRRCRKFSGNYVPTSVDELIWRKDAPAKLGRANPEGYQILYLADRRDTALFEARVESDVIAIAEFEIQAGKQTRVVPIGELSQAQRTGRGFLSGDASHALTRMLNSSSIDDATSLLITDAFLLDCLVGHDDYNLSSFVALSIFEKNPVVRVIAYPSKRQRGAINFAVRVEDFWDAWALSSVSYGAARHLAFGYFKVANKMGVDVITDNGCLRWCNVNDPNERILVAPPYCPPNKG